MSEFEHEESDERRAAREYHEETLREGMAIGREKADEEIVELRTRVAELVELNEAIIHHAETETGRLRAALAAERAKVERLRGALIDANDICRSAFTIANRIATEFSTIEFNTMFGAFAAKAKESLCRQHTVIHETGGYPRAAIGVETGEV